ncbi:allene oxide cyclase barrel-like domain-containing protein [Pseudonocardia sp. CA-107938]|uniref:allene oxide cyclase barrel-like domain-containing protein n=1 Tax=Pseudonocardia sp. CA-107938 TaxID=3240021 RepID=UPI003D8F0888
MYRKTALRRSIVAVVAGSLLAGGLSACGAEAGSASPSEHTEILEFAVENDQYAAPDLAPAGPSVGDLYVYSGWLLKDGRRAGQGGGSCQIIQIDGAKITTQCLLTGKLEQGSLTMQALWVTGESPLDMAITGGTGAYADAHGTVRVWDIATPNERMRAEITHVATGHAKDVER